MTSEELRAMDAATFAAQSVAERAADIPVVQRTVPAAEAGPSGWTSHPLYAAWHPRANGHAQKTPQEGANRDASAEQSHGAGGSDSPAGRGTNGAPAVSAAPAFLQAEPEGAAAIAGGPETAEETTQRGAVDATAAANHPGAGDDAKPAVGAAAPNGLRCALWNDGELIISRPSRGLHAMLTRDETRELVRYLDSISLDSVREVAA